MARILAIDDDTSLREVVGFILTEAGHEVLEAADGESGLARLDADTDLVITDMRMPGIDGMEVLRRVREGDDPPPVIVLTAHGTVEQAVAAMQAGAATYLLKPFARDELRLTVEQVLHTRELERDNHRLRGLLKQQSPSAGMIHRSRAMAAVMAQLERAAPSDATVLITGESGTGKELAARACHDQSPRWDHPFVAVNCAAIPGELMEAELFGHRRGAFTGADRDRPGRIRAAAGGTLFLDEIGDLPLDLQPKLLRVLEERVVDPVGGGAPVPVDFRLVCATHRDLEAAAADGAFRRDLLYRLDVLPLHLPPLRERPEDIPALWDHFTRRHADETLVTDADLAAELLQRPWPGNVRELKNLNQRLVVLRQGATLTLADLRRLAPRGAESAPARGLPLGPLPEEGFSLPELEAEVIRRALRRCGGNRTRTAQYLGVARHVLIYRIEKYGLAET